MGAYINPPDMPKEAWLSRNALIVDRETVEKWDDFTDKLPVIWLDNGLFTAAGIAYDGPERDAFLRPDHGVQRPRKYFICEKQKLLKVSNLKTYLEEE